jgi:pimeloyl-ACP methyl ester carboxylesterase
LAGDIAVSPYRQVPRGRLSSCATTLEHHRWTTEEVDRFIRVAHERDKRPEALSYGSRSAKNIVGLVRSLAAAIPTATTRQIDGGGHAAPFDATANFVQLIADSITTSA